MVSHLWSRLGLVISFHRSACLLKAVELHAAGEDLLDVVRHQKPYNFMHRRFIAGFIADSSPIHRQ